MVIVLLGILGTLGISFFAPMINLYFFTPTQLRIEYTGNQTIKDMIEGNNTAKGLRIMKRVTSATTTAITYLDKNDISVTLTWDNVNLRITRTVNAVTTVLPILSPQTDVKIDGIASGVIFKYYDSSNVLLASPVVTPANIARIQMDLVAYTGSGEIKAYQGKYYIRTGVFLKQF